MALIRSVFILLQHFLTLLVYVTLNTDFSSGQLDLSV